MTRPTIVEARRRMSGVVRQAARTVSRRIDRYRVHTIRGGAAEGMRIGRLLASNEYRDGLVEPPVQTAIADLMRPGAVFFDIGANVGFFTLVAARAVGGDATFVAFEPRQDVADALRANLRRNSIDAAVWPVAVGDREGTVELFVAEHPGGATIAADKTFDTEGVVSVRQVTIDALVDAGEVPVPDVVKLDVEGAEPAVIRGMERTLQQHRTTMVFEIDAPTVAAAETQFDEVVSVLRDLGYECERLAASYEGAGWSVIHAVARPS